MEQKPIGLYLHIPFCSRKCPYCDFYSVCPQPGQTEAYIEAAARRLESFDHVYDTVYFGGGTPGMLGSEGLVRLLHSIEKKLIPGCEITTELNPGGTNLAFFKALKAGGFNRISMGLQSADSGELAALGRGHDAQGVRLAVQQAKAAGFTNISLDLMLGVPGSSSENLLNSIAFCTQLDIPHLSCYMLKVEPGTPYADMALDLPHEDAVCDAYLMLVRELESRGLAQYEISNFARPGFESRHNLKYWNCEEYLGIGPAAHSFLDGTRSYYPRDLGYFLAGGEAVPDGPGGGLSEYVLLRLRLSAGMRADHCTQKFGATAFEALLQKAKKLPPPLVKADKESIAFTPEGFLVSNTLIGALLEE